MSADDPMLDGITRCHICGDEITDWGFGSWHHVTGIKTPFRGHDHDAVGMSENTFKAVMAVLWMTGCVVVFFAPELFGLFR